MKKGLTIITVITILCIVFGILDAINWDSIFVDFLTNSKVTNWDFPYKWFVGTICIPLFVVIMTESIRRKYFRLSQVDKLEIKAIEQIYPDISIAVDLVGSFTFYIQGSFTPDEKEVREHLGKLQEKIYKYSFYFKDKNIQKKIKEINQSISHLTRNQMRLNYYSKNEGEAEKIGFDYKKMWGEFEEQREDFDYKTIKLLKELEQDVRRILFKST